MAKFAGSSGTGYSSGYGKTTSKSREEQGKSGSSKQYNQGGSGGTKSGGGKSSPPNVRFSGDYGQKSNSNQSSYSRGTNFSSADAFKMNQGGYSQYRSPPGDKKVSVASRTPYRNISLLNSWNDGDANDPYKPQSGMDSYMAMRQGVNPYYNASSYTYHPELSMRPTGAYGGGAPGIGKMAYDAITQKNQDRIAPSETQVAAPNYGSYLQVAKDNASTPLRGNNVKTAAAAYSGYGAYPNIPAQMAGLQQDPVNIAAQNMAMMTPVPSPRPNQVAMQGGRNGFAGNANSYAPATTQTAMQGGRNGFSGSPYNMNPQMSGPVQERNRADFIYSPSYSMPDMAGQPVRYQDASGPETTPDLAAGDPPGLVDPNKPPGDYSYPRKAGPGATMAAKIGGGLFGGLFGGVGGVAGGAGAGSSLVNGYNRLINMPYSGNGVQTGDGRDGYSNQDYLDRITPPPTHPASPVAPVPGNSTVKPPESPVKRPPLVYPDYYSSWWGGLPKGPYG